jgi:hypothetical protein
MAHIEPLIDAQPAAQILGLLPITQGASVPNGSIESHADKTLDGLCPDATRDTDAIHRYLLALARGGLAGAYAIGTGTMRKVWVFRLSELATAVEEQSPPIPKTQKCVTIRSGSLRAEKRSI